MEDTMGWRWFARYSLVWIFLSITLLLVFMVFGELALVRAIGPALAMTIPNAVLGLASLRLAWRWPLVSRRSVGFAVRHVLALSVYVVLGALIWNLVRIAESSLLALPLTPVAGVLVFWLSFTNLLAHAVMTAIGYVWKASIDIRAEQARAQESERLRSKAELALLRTQLNPHFLLNTLHALMGLVRRDPALAERAIETLGDLVKIGQGLQATGDSVSLRQEWDFVSRYLELEKLRFGDRLRTRLSAADRDLDLLVPPFSLLPLVENAVIHGVGSRAEGGEVRVAAERGPDHVVLRVEDSGPGSSSEEILGSARLGLRLLRERLAHLYGNRAALRFSTGADGYFIARMSLPLDVFHAE